MIKIIEEKKGTSSSCYVTLFSDTKAEVPTTGAATKPLIQGWGNAIDLPYGSLVYTAEMEVGLLKSDDTWSWLS